MSNPTVIAERYLEAFNETDPAARRRLLEEIYTSNATYTDPHVDLAGPEAIDGFIAQTQERFPGFEFRLEGPVDAHHDQARFQWQAGPAGEPALYAGFDVIVTRDERIDSVYGFADPAPAA